MTARPKKIRADRLLFERGLANSREQAQALIMEGVVYTPSGRVSKAGSTLLTDAEIEVKGRLPFVSRGGLKLAHALDQFKIDVNGLAVLDVGASTGGFTDCVLQRGARHVYAVDVGHGQIDYGLRQDGRVTVMEKINARYPFDLLEQVDLVTMDVSFISISQGLRVRDMTRSPIQGDAGNREFFILLQKAQD